MPIEEKDLELILLGAKVVRRPYDPSRPGLYWYTTRGGYNMNIFKNLADIDNPKPYEWYCSTVGCSFTASGKETSLEEAIKEAHVHLAQFIVEKSHVEQSAMNFLPNSIPHPTRFERDPVL
jgi:hypothetical protein